MNGYVHQKMWMNANSTNMEKKNKITVIISAKTNSALLMKPEKQLMFTALLVEQLSQDGHMIITLLPTSVLIITKESKNECDKKASNNE
jgi:hypothetical protein